MSERIIPLKVCHGTWRNFCYFIRDPATSEAVIVDPAWELSTIMQEISRKKMHLKGVLLTHGHEDHSNLATMVQKLYKVPVFVHIKEIESCNFKGPTLEPIRTEETICLGENLRIEPWWTPGHTKGSICYFAYDALFTGDTLFIEGCGICDRNDIGSTSEMFNTLKRIKNSLSSHSRIFPGHSYGFPPGTSFGETIKTNIYLHFDNEYDFSRFRMRENQRSIYNFK
ncbi:MBL fold metallo-hydrolase [Nibrella saemangeumensis]|uniref:MBL fold metallo-hydrolase n=1 Tax=Nibrella saemangeumensis TaxID=1084526 RepID=UPI0031E6ED85